MAEYLWEKVKRMELELLNVKAELEDEREHSAVMVEALGCVCGTGACDHPMCPHCAIAAMIRSGK